MRLFIAIELDNFIRSEFAYEINYLKSHFPKIRWVDDENLHITLKFLGDVEENDMRDICNSLDYIAEENESFSLEIANIGCFPNVRSPRVVWAGCREGSNYAENLVKKIDSELLPSGFKPEKRKYTPHITIGRVKQPSYADGLGDIIADAQEINFGFLDVSEITLFMSELKKSGPVYSPLYRVKLR